MEILNKLLLHRTYVGTEHSERFMLFPSEGRGVQPSMTRSSETNTQINERDIGSNLVISILPWGSLTCRLGQSGILPVNHLRPKTQLPHFD